MCNPKVDDLSMMTYLSQFPNAKLKPGAPLRPKTNPARVRAYGPGIEPTGNSVGAPARFTVETFSAGRGELEIVLLNPKGVKETVCTMGPSDFLSNFHCSLQVEVTLNNDRNLTYSCVYVPSMEGTYKVSSLLFFLLSNEKTLDFFRLSSSLPTKKSRNHLTPLLYLLPLAIPPKFSAVVLVSRRLALLSRRRLTSKCLPKVRHIA
jgi:hypothetical protein